MLLLNIFIIFSAIFVALTFEYHSNFFEPNTKTLIKSLSMYARIFGKLPNDNYNKQIPWNKIGISPLFFQQKIKYEANIDAIKNDLTPPDFKFLSKHMAEYSEEEYYDDQVRVNINYLAFTDEKKFELSEYENLKNNTIYKINNPFKITIANNEIIMNKASLAEYAHYPIEVAELDQPIFGAVIYNVDSEKFYFNILPYY